LRSMWSKMPIWRTVASVGSAIVISSPSESFGDTRRRRDDGFAKVRRVGFEGDEGTGQRDRRPQRAGVIEKGCGDTGVAVVARWIGGRYALFTHGSHVAL